MATRWKAAADKVIVQLAYEAGSRTTESGIVIPDKVKMTKVGRGVVLAAGPDAKNVNVGDVILFDEKGAAEIDTNVKAMHVDYVLGIQREDRPRRSAGLRFAVVHSGRLARGGGADDATI